MRNSLEEKVGLPMEAAATDTTSDDQERNHGGGGWTESDESHRKLRRTRTSHSLELVVKEQVRLGELEIA